MKEELSEAPPPGGLRRKFWRGAFGLMAGVASGTVLAIGTVAGPAGIYHDANRAINFLYHFANSAPLAESVSDAVE
jgi:hypothetical protein